jgi:hypothetical protein
MIAWAWVSLAWAASVAFWVIVSFARERHWPSNYHEFCEIVGLCVFWPFTLTLEIALTIRERRRRASDSRTSRQATSQV